VPRTQRSAPHVRRGVLQSRGPSWSRTESVGPGSAEQRCTLHRVRERRMPAAPAASCALVVVERTRVTTSTPEFTRRSRTQWF
jgi:hypothetical protein